MTGDPSAGTAVTAGTKRRAALATMTLGSFIVVLDAAIVFIPLPAILADLDGTLDQGAWVLGAFILVFAVFLVPSARLAQRYDRRVSFVVGTSVFTAASLACALAPSMEVLLAARAVQGLGAALLETSVFALLKAVFPEPERERAFRVQAGAVGLGALLGPILGGVLTTGLSWHFVFWLNVLVGVVVLAAALLVVPSSRGEGAARGDVTGVVLGGAALLLTTFALIEGPPIGWGSPVVVGSLVAAVVLFVCCAAWERRSSTPLVEWRLFRFRRFATGNVLRGAAEFASLGLFFAVSHFLQTELGYSALVAGALLMAVIVGALLGSPVAEAATARVDVRWLVVTGFVLLAGGIFWVAHVAPDTGWEFFIAPLLVAGAGFGLMESTVTEGTRTALPDARSTDGWATSYTSYLLGIVLGIAAVAAVWQSATFARVPESARVGDGAVSAYLARGGPPPGDLGSVLSGAVSGALNTALLACVAVCLLGAVVGFFLAPARTEKA